MIKVLILFLLTTILVGSCASSITQTVPPPTATSFSTVPPSPAPSLTPTTTPYPALKTQGPYLLFTRDNHNLTIMDADGGGQNQIELPHDSYIYQLDKSVSPDGKWLAYFTGSTEAPYELALNVLNLSNETTQPVSKLLASGFPANLEPLVETMVLGDPPRYPEDCFENIECRRSLVERELANSIFAFDWSPDSQSIAFPAQIDGPSSDIYIYTLQDKSIRRLTTELQNIYWLDWAPHGARILFEISTTPGEGYEGRTLHITDLEGKTTFINEERLYNQRWGEYGWLTENLYLFDHPNDTDKPPMYDLMALDTGTGQFKEIWPYSLETFAVNRDNKTIVLIHKNHTSLKATVPDGIYMVYPSGKYLKISDIGIQFVVREGQKPYPVFSQDYNRQTYSIDNDGTINMLPWVHESIPWISPDTSVLLFAEPQKLALYNSFYEPLKSWQMEDDRYSLTWRPDSLGVFIFTEKNVYSLAISDEQPRSVEYCPLERCEPVRFIWLP